MLLEELKKSLKYYSFQDDSKQFCKQNYSDGYFRISFYEYAAELIKITRSLKDNNIEFSVDENRNVQLIS
jgi:hypothetical protein